MFWKKQDQQEPQYAPGSKREYFNRLNNDPHMLAASEAIRRIAAARSLQEVHAAGDELNREIDNALHGSTPRDCLTTILTEISNEIAILRLTSGGGSLLEQRISVLQTAFERLDRSY